MDSVISYTYLLGFIDEKNIIMSKKNHKLFQSEITNIIFVSLTVLVQNISLEAFKSN